MSWLKGEKVYLRAIDLEDVDFIAQVENDESLWEYSNVIAPFSKYIIEQYVLNSFKDIYETKQLRFIISDYEDYNLGIIDLFDFDFKNKRAGVGVLIAKTGDRKKGYAKEALKLLENYAFKQLDLHQLYCNINEDNFASLGLFEAAGFEIVGLKKDWNYYSGNFKNEYLLQLIKN